MRKWGKEKSEIFYIFSKVICHTSYRVTGKSAISGVLIFVPTWSLPQDDKGHESAFKNRFHAGVFCQPELGMEHVQYGNADVWAESWRSESK